mmetsp:Transcript_6124/g.11068  ORF Transcript_6124/g.11068 Transcript_6124/m.11068 type:complete len:383 (-) Transcript_6124:316-1464(-)
MLIPKIKPSRACCVVVWALSSLDLYNAFPVSVDILPSGGQQNASTENGTNFADYSLIVDQDFVPAHNCSFLVRFAEVTRRRRTRQLLQDMETSTIRSREVFAPHGLDPASRLTGVGMSFLAGLSTVIGAGVVFLLPSGQATPSQMSFVLALAGGVMISATVLEFWLPLLTSFSILATARVLICSALGAISFVLLSKFVPEPHFVETDIENGSRDPMEVCIPESGVKDEAAKRSWHLAKVLLLSLTAHNLPEGFAVAVSSLGSETAGFVVMLAIAMHNIPEGIAIAVPVLAATGSRRKALWMTFLSGMAEPLGALLALFLIHTTGAVSQDSIENLLCAVGGVMLAVAAQELFPDAWNYGKPVSFISGSLLGVLLMVITIICGA